MANFTQVEQRYTLVPIVLPIAEDPAISGKIKHLPCAPQVSHRWVAPFVTDGRVEYGITPLYQRKGYVLLRDLFVAEGRYDDWAAYERHLADIQDNKRNLKPFPEDRLPAEVRRRRACGHDPVTEAPAKGRGKASS